MSVGVDDNKTWCPGCGSKTYPVEAVRNMETWVDRARASARQHGLLFRYRVCEHQIAQDILRAIDSGHRLSGALSTQRTVKHNTVPVNRILRELIARGAIIRDRGGAYRRVGKARDRELVERQGRSSIRWLMEKGYIDRERGRRMWDELDARLAEM